MLLDVYCISKDVLDLDLNFVENAIERARELVTV